jgi:DNA mismatch repair protein MutS2
MAARLGLPASVVTSARALLSARDVRLAEQIARLDRDVQALEHERRAAARERQTLENAVAAVRQREESVREREDAFGRRLNEQLGAQVRQARREIDGIIDDLKTRTDAMARDAAKQGVTTGETGAVRSHARNAVDTVISRLSAGDAEPMPAPPPAVEGRAPEVGDRVVVGGFGLQGVVTALHGDAADVDVNGKRMRARTADLRIISGAPAATARVKVNIDLRPREGSTTDLNVIGCTVDEALVRAERFLDESLLGEQRTLRVIHGYGTGQLKRALNGFLHQHPLVAHIASAPPEQGGGGVTVVELKD